MLACAWLCIKPNNPMSNTFTTPIPSPKDVPENTCVVCFETNKEFYDTYLCRDCARKYGIRNTKIGRKFYQYVFSIANAAFSIIQREINKPEGLQDKDALSFAIAPLNTFRTAKKFLYWHRLVSIAQDIDGDFVECGVGAGESLLHISTLALEYQPFRRVWGFDSFEGFPQFSQEDTSHRRQNNSDWKFDGQLVKILLDTFIQYGIPLTWVQSNVTLVQGYFETSLKLYTGNKIALLHIDADLYQSYKTCLEAFYPLVAENGIIAFDEYMGTLERHNFPGASRAIDEFLADKKVERGRDLYSGKYFIIKRE